MVRAEKKAEHTRTHGNRLRTHHLLPWLEGRAYSDMGEATQVSRTAHTLSPDGLSLPQRKFQEATQQEREMDGASRRALLVVEDARRICQALERSNWDLI